MNKEELFALIDEKITTNGKGDITGASLNEVLKAVAENGGGGGSASLGTLVFDDEWFDEVREGNVPPYKTISLTDIGMTKEQVMNEFKNLNIPKLIIATTYEDEGTVLGMTYMDLSSFSNEAYTNSLEVAEFAFEMIVPEMLEELGIEDDTIGNTITEHTGGAMFFVGDENLYAAITSF